MNKKLLIIFPIVIIGISTLLYFALGRRRPNDFETPILFSIVILLFIKINKYNKKLKKHRYYETSGKIPTTIDKEAEEYKMFQRTLSVLILEMFIVYFVSIAVFSVIL